MTKEAAAGPLDLALAVGERPAPPSGSVSAMTTEPARDISWGAAAEVPGIPANAILDLGRAPAGGTPGTPFGSLRSHARGMLGRSRGLAGIALGAVRTRAPWRGFRTRTTAALGSSVSASASPGDTLVGAAPVRRYKKTWREQRWERRRRRRIVEEVLGWILVPIILVSAGWGVKAGLNALGTTPTALISGLKAAISGRGG